jgi:hypothetical protein
MVVDKDIKMEEFKGLMATTIVGKFMGKNVKRETIKQWMSEQWKPVVGYLPKFHLLDRGWLCFVLSCEEDKQ